MAIRVRRGLKDDFDPTKMLPGEWAVSIDSDTSKQIVWMCFAPGVTKRMGTYEDFKQQVADATKDVKEEYVQALQEILNEIEPLVETSNENTNTVIQIRDDIVDTYLPEMLGYLNISETAAQTATEQAEISTNSATLSKSYAVGGTGTRENEDIENAKFYYEQAERIAQGLSGTLLPCGTITFEKIADVQAIPGYMYNISNDFVSDDRFIHSGISHGVGANIYMTIDGKWDVLAGSNVISVNGKTGVVILKASDIECNDGETVQSKLDKVGLVDDLTTGVKDTIVNAINWLNNSLKALSNSLTGLAQRISKNETAISDLNTNLTKLNSDLQIVNNNANFVKYKIHFYDINVGKTTGVTADILNTYLPQIKGGFGICNINGTYDNIGTLLVTGVASFDDNAMFGKGIYFSTYEGFVHPILFTMSNGVWSKDV